MNTERFISQILEKMLGLSKNRRKFMEHVLFLFLCLRGRYNFMNLSRWGLFSPGCYEGHFHMAFDWLGFNTLLVNSSMKGKKAIALDPSYLPKSGKKTAGLGRFYSGCAGRTLWGLEIMGLAAIDLESNTSLHLEAIQTIAKKGGNLLEVYGQSLLEIKDRLQKDLAQLDHDDYVFAWQEKVFSKVNVLRIYVI